MENNNNGSDYRGLSFFSILGLIFITLKLCGVINWSWWIVLSPFWGGFAIFIVVTIVVMVILTINNR